MSEAEHIEWPSSRQLARSVGSARYNGHPCINCGNVLRYTRSKKCVRCFSEKQKLRSRARTIKRKEKNPRHCECGNAIPVHFSALRTTCSEFCQNVRKNMRTRSIKKKSRVRTITCMGCSKQYVGTNMFQCCSEKCREQKILLNYKNRRERYNERNRERFSRHSAAVRALEELGVKF